MAYYGKWTSTDQVAKRAVDSGLVNRFGSLDPTTGGETYRYSLSGEWASTGQNSQSRASVWWLKSGLDLWSNFQVCLNDFAATGSCSRGDQFKQSERREAAGFAVSHTIFTRWGSHDVENAFGLQGRYDRLSPVGLYATEFRNILSTVREDKVSQGNLGLWAQNAIHWTPWLRSIGGLRSDVADFRVDSNLAANSGKASAQMLTPRLSLIFGPWRKTEFYLNYGHGFHSNDARGTTIQVNPADGVTPVERVKPLVRTRGYELGMRSEPLANWQTTLSVWQLDAASELLFIGDAGTTEPTRPSRRRGVEWTNLYTPTDWLAIDADLSWSQARFRAFDPAGDHIPGAVTTTANLSASVDKLGSWFASIRLRYFGPRPLIEDNSIRSSASALANLRLGYKIDRDTRLALDIYNLFDRKVNDVEYWYESQLAGESSPVVDRHVHPTEPRSLRLTVSHRF